VFDLSGHHVVVTGALGGIGLCTCRVLASLGSRVTAVDLADTASGFRALAEAGLHDAHYVSADLTSSDGLQALDEAMAAGPAPTAMVSLAGIVVSGDLAAQSNDDIASVINVNVTAQATTAQLFLRRWVADGVAGTIVLTSSWVSHVPWPSITPYAASKAAVEALTRGIAREYATQGIRANAIAPGIVDVGMAARQWRDEPDYRSRAQRAVPLGRLQQPDEVAQGIAFLLSPWSAYMTGSVLLIDGGASLYPMDPEDVNRA
jgi:NAD(P)-dependent dehydrogenase (short-subunit alcohol dehydrogenase family)